MPDRAYWNGFFDAECVVHALLGPRPVHGDVLELGCGYGTFSFAAARHVEGSLRALDIEADLVSELALDAARQGLDNVHAEQRDFIVRGTGVDDQSQAHVMIYNLLHLEDPLSLLGEAHRVLRSGGQLSIIHWRSDIETPRGPPLEIRPTPEQCREWLLASGFEEVRQPDLSRCCDYHFGMTALKVTSMKASINTG